MSGDRFAGLQAEISRRRDEQDADLMISGFPVKLLIDALDVAVFDDDDRGLIRSALLVKRYDFGRHGGDREESGLLEAWYASCFPDGVAPRYPYQYLVEDPVAQAPLPVRKGGFWAGVFAWWRR